MLSLFSLWETALSGALNGHSGRKQKDLQRVSAGQGNAPVIKGHTLLILTMHSPELVISHPWGTRSGNPEEGGSSQKEEELEYLETSINDYHIYGNLRIHSSICGRTLKIEHIVCLTCVSVLSVS